MDDITGFAFVVCVFICIFIFVALCFSLYTRLIEPVMQERKYMITEISRTRGSEQRHWKRKLKMLYIKAIPIIGPFIVKRMLKK